MSRLFSSFLEPDYESVNDFFKLINGTQRNLYATEIGIVACRNHAQHEAEVFETLLPYFEDFSQQDFDRLEQALTIFSGYFKKKLNE